MESELVKIIFKITLKGIYGFIERKVTKFGSGVKDVCLMEFLESRVYLLTIRDKE